MKIICGLRHSCFTIRILNCSFFGSFLLLLLILDFISVLNFYCGSLIWQKNEINAFSFRVLTAVALVITRMTRADSCLSKHISAYSGDLDYFIPPFYFVWYK